MTLGFLSPPILPQAGQFPGRDAAIPGGDDFHRILDGALDADALGWAPDPTADPIEDPRWPPVAVPLLPSPPSPQPPQALAQLEPTSRRSEVWPRAQAPSAPPLGGQAITTSAPAGPEGPRGPRPVPLAGWASTQIRQTPPQIAAPVHQGAPPAPQGASRPIAAPDRTAPIPEAIGGQVRGDQSPLPPVPRSVAASVGPADPEAPATAPPRPPSAADPEAPPPGDAPRPAASPADPMRAADRSPRPAPSGDPMAASAESTRPASAPMEAAPSAEPTTSAPSVDLPSGPAAPPVATARNGSGPGTVVAPAPPPSEAPPAPDLPARPPSATDPVRVEVDADLAVELTPQRDGIKVVLDGTSQALDPLRGIDADLDSTLRDAGSSLASFAERHRRRRAEGAVRTADLDPADPDEADAGSVAALGSLINAVA